MLPSAYKATYSAPSAITVSARRAGGPDQSGNNARRVPRKVVQQIEHVAPVEPVGETHRARITDGKGDIAQAEAPPRALSQQDPLLVDVDSADHEVGRHAPEIETEKPETAADLED